MNTNRRADLAKIHLAKKQLGLDNETYRDMLWTVARVRSAGDLDEDGRRKVIGHLRSRGAQFDPPKRGGKRPHNFNRLPEYVDKVEALLADMGLSWAYADSIAYRITGGKGRKPGADPGVERLAWVRKEQHWRDIIAALHVEQEKRAKHAAVLERLRQAGKDESHLETLFPGGLPSNWHRNRRLLEAILACLPEVRP